MDELVRDVINTLTVHEQEVRDKDGHWYLLRARPYLSYDKKLEGAIVALVDISDATRTEHQARVSGGRYRRLFESAQDGVLIVDSVSRKITEANPFMVELLGLAAEAIIGKELWQIGLFADEQANKTAFADLYAKGVIRYECAPLKTAAGKQYHVDVVANLYDENDKRAIQCNIRDITARKQAETELRHALKDLKEMHRRKDDFLAMLAHELRNPLAAISNAEQILRLFPNGEKAQEAMPMLGRQVAQMVRLVDDLLDVSRISHGKIEIRTKRVDLGACVRDALAAAKTFNVVREHELTISLPPQPIYVEADSARLVQIVDNLLNNACKFTDKGGHIGVILEREAEEAVLRVRDDGTGIAADQLSRIFEMFTQVSNPLERSGSGLGLGLTLVKTLVEMHGGTVKARSAGIGQGSEFVLRLPIFPEAPAAPPVPKVSEIAAVGARRILVVDDNRDSATSLAALLQAGGQEVQVAFSGIEALKEAESFRPEVMLLDIGMPKMNGYEVARTVRQQPWGDKMWLVALTGWGQEAYRQESKDAGFDHHLVKPVSRNDLLKLLAEMDPRQ